MEPLISSQSFRNRIVILILITWGVVAALLLWQFRLISICSSHLDELTNRLLYFREAIHLPQPYRANQAIHLEQELELVQSLRIKIEAEQSSIWLARDVQQILYQTDRFIEQARGFLAIELLPIKLAERFRENRQYANTDSQLVINYFELAAFSFEALFGEHKNNPEIYRSLDRMLKDSWSLPSDQKERLQTALAEVAHFLGQYVEGEGRVKSLLNHKVYEEVDLLEDEYHHQLWWMMVIIISVSFGGMVCFMLLLLARQPLIFSSSVSDNRQIVNVDAVTHSLDIAKLTKKLNGNLTELQSILKTFLDKHQNDDEQIRKLIETDPMSAQLRCENLSVAAASIGADQLKSVALGMASELKEGRSPNPQVIENFSLSLAAIVSDVKRHLSC